MAYLNVTNTPAASFFSRISTAFDGLATRYQQYRVYRDTFNELSALSHRDLADLGLHRSEIARVAREAAYK